MTTDHSPRHGTGSAAVIANLILLRRTLNETMAKYGLSRGYYILC